MTKVIFKFNKEKDLWNIWDTCNFKSSWNDNFLNGIHPKILELCKGKNFRETKQELKNYQKKIHSSKLMSVAVDSFNKAWEKINDEFFKRLEKIMKKPFCCEEITGYLTTVGRCPYNYKKNNPYFFVNFANGIFKALKTAGHEIMHIQFHNTYWKEIEEKIGKEKTADLKEALTVLLNLEFKDLWLVRDEGYPSHQDLRKFIVSQWKKEKDFDILMEKCVNYLKK